MCIRDSPEYIPQIGSAKRKGEIIPELDQLLEDNFLRYDGTGEVPSQIHSYLSTNFKELRNLAKDDPTLIAKAADRWYVPDPNKAQDLEKKRERALLKEFESYRSFTGRRIKESRPPARQAVAHGRAGAVRQEPPQRLPPRRWSRGGRGADDLAHGAHTRAHGNIVRSSPRVHRARGKDHRGRKKL